MKSSLTPTGYRVLIKPDPLEEKSEGGILIVHQDERLARAGTQTGTLVAVGKTAWADSPEPWCSVGDHVIYAKYAGKIVTDPDTAEEYMIVNDEDVLAIRS